MKILMILSKLPKTFRSDARVYNEAKSLVDAGHEVAVVAWDRRHEDDSGDVVAGIRIIRLYNDFIMKGLRKDLFRNPIWWRKAYRKGIELYKNGFDFSVVHCHDLDTLKTGAWLKKKFKCKLIYDAHEIFPYMLEGNVSNLVVWYASRMERQLLRYVDHIITVDEGYAEYFRKITNKPLTIIRNCKDLMGEYFPPSRKKFTLIYIGTLNRSRFFPQLLHVVGKIKDVKLIIAAKKEDIDIYNEIDRLAKTFENIEFLGSIDGSEVLPLTKEGHAVVCLFDPASKMNQIGSPNKLFEAMTTGRPIIVTKGTHAGDMVEQEHCGLAVEYSEKGLEKAIKLLRDNPALCEELGKNGLHAAQQKYNWALQQKELLKIYETMKGKTY